MAHDPLLDAGWSLAGPGGTLYVYWPMGAPLSMRFVLPQQTRLAIGRRKPLHQNIGAGYWMLTLHHIEYREGSESLAQMQVAYGEVIASLKGIEDILDSAGAASPDFVAVLTTPYFSMNVAVADVRITTPEVGFAPVGFAEIDLVETLI